MARQIRGEKEKTEPKPLVTLPEDFKLFLATFAVLAENMRWKRLSICGDAAERMAYMDSREYESLRRLSTTAQLGEIPGNQSFIGCVSSQDYYSRFWSIVSKMAQNRPLIAELEQKITIFNTEVAEMKRDGIDKAAMRRAAMHGIVKNVKNEIAGQENA